MRARRRLGNEDGSSLIFAMALLTMFSVTSVAVLSLTGVSANDSAVTRSALDQLYAADGGVETGIRMLQTDQAEGTNDLCPAVSGSFSDVGTTSINGKEVSIACRTTAGGTTSTTSGGGTALLGGYSAVFGTSGLTIGGNTGNGAPSTKFNGRIYSGGPMSVPSSAPLLVDGDLRTAAACPPLPANVAVTGDCSTLTAPSIAVPTVVVPTVIAAAPTSFGATCQIFYPGKYTTAPAFSSTVDSYLASGTYSFAGTGDVNLVGTIFGGAAGTESKEMTTASPCATDADAQTLNAAYVASTAGAGVTILLGGNALLRTQSGAEVELFSRVPLTAAGSRDLGATPRVNVWARTTAQTNYVASTSSPALTTQDKSASVVFHGLTYLPSSLASIREPLNEGAGGTSMFAGGIVVRGLTIDMQGNTANPGVAEIGGTPIVTTTSYPTRTTLICVLAASTDDGSPTRVEAAVSLASTPVVQAWREVLAC